MRLKKALFVHSHKFIYGPDSKVYSNGQYPYKTWLRYLEHFDHLTIAARYENSEEVSQLNLSSGDNVTHIKMPNLATIKHRKKNKQKVEQMIQKEVEKVDFIIARLPSDLGLLAINEARLNNKPYVIELVGDIYNALWYHGSVFGKILAPFAYRKIKKVLKSAPYVLYVTENFLQARYPSRKLRVTTSCSNVELPDLVQIEKKIKKQIFTIGLIGSYSSKYKGIINALNVVERLNSNGYKVVFRILGQGNTQIIESKCEELGITHLVKIDGALPGGKPVLDWLSNLDLYIQPSLTEGLPRSVIEAMYCGLPCVASRVGGIPELIDEKWLHKPKDEKKMYSLVKKMYLDNNLRKEQGERNRRVALKYTKRNLDRKRSEFWRNILLDLKEMRK